MATVPPLSRASPGLRTASMGHVLCGWTRPRTTHLRVLSHPRKLRGGAAGDGGDGDPVVPAALACYGYGGGGRASAQLE